MDLSEYYTVEDLEKKISDYSSSEHFTFLQKMYYSPLYLSPHKSFPVIFEDSGVWYLRQSFLRTYESFLFIILFYKHPA